MNTGKFNLSELGEISKINSKKSDICWPGVCGNLKGSLDGIVFSPFINKSSKIYIFEHEMHRSVELIEIKTDRKLIKNYPASRCFIDNSSILDYHLIEELDQNDIYKHSGLNPNKTKHQSYI